LVVSLTVAGVLMLAVGKGRPAAAN
jgi:hypothetical protein